MKKAPTRAFSWLSGYYRFHISDTIKTLAAFNQEKALGAFSVIMNIRMDIRLKL